MKTPAIDESVRLLDVYANLAVSNSAASRFGARLVALCKFVDAVLPQLTARQCRQIAPLFRQGVEDAMSQTDDMLAPSAYHATLLEQTNILMTALEKKGATLS
jgi:hypothetical protein